jgi:hypothetical protein
MSTLHCQVKQASTLAPETNFMIALMNRNSDFITTNLVVRFIQMKWDNEKGLIRNGSSLCTEGT